MFTAHAEFRNHSTTMESDTAVHNMSMERSSGGLDKVSGCSQISTEQNERRISSKDEEIVENEAVSHKRCHAKNKKTRARQPARPVKPAQHHVNSINYRRTLVLEARLHVFQHRNKLGHETFIHAAIEAKWPTT
ncbi:hypothetical protein C8R44DRAFT_741494 [Mycena epipterygia]|nr:hypothetical protein C8R44DRAFT_741494 [Mycena epipterygia]